MSESMLVALQIAFIGMALVFFAILLFWLIISLLVRVTAVHEAAPAAESPDEVEQERKRRAAATAVAFALALEADTQPRVLPAPPTPIVSAWQAVMRSNILDKRGSVR